MDVLSRNMGDIYKCPKCGAGMVVYDTEDCPWTYNKKTGKWEHKCLNYESQKENSKEG